MYYVEIKTCYRRLVMFQCFLFSPRHFLLFLFEVLTSGDFSFCEHVLAAGDLLCVVLLDLSFWRCVLAEICRCEACTCNWQTVMCAVLHRFFTFFLLLAGLAIQCKMGPCHFSASSQSNSVCHFSPNWLARRIKEEIRCYTTSVETHPGDWSSPTRASAWTSTQHLHLTGVACVFRLIDANVRRSSSSIGISAMSNSTRIISAFSNSIRSTPTPIRSRLALGFLFWTIRITIITRIAVVHERR